MLVLSRKTDESIVIDGRIEVTVVQIEGGRVRLGITAPREVAIRRSELPPREDLEHPAHDRTGVDRKGIERNPGAERPIRLDESVFANH